MVTTKKEFIENGDRYMFDRALVPEGYAQIDTTSDAWYCGAWACPIKRKIVSYAEGDLVIHSCETDEEFAKEIHRMVETYKKRETWKHIDSTWETCKDSEVRFKELGLGKYLAD